MTQRHAVAMGAALGLIVFGLTPTSCTPGQKQVARTVVDVARTACELFAVEQAQKQGVSSEQLVRQLCTTESDLRPWIDHLLSAQRERLGEGACPAPGLPQDRVPGAVSPAPAPPPQSVPWGQPGAPADAGGG